MRRRWRLALVFTAWLSAVATAAGQETADPPPGPLQALPGTPAPAHVIMEVRQALDDAIRRFEAMDAPGVLAHVSDLYRTGPVTKAVLAEQLRVIFALHDVVEARVSIDAVRMVGEQAWVYSTGDVTGRVRWTSSLIPLFTWQGELEVARREGARWRLFGYQ